MPLPLKWLPVSLAMRTRSISEAEVVRWSLDRTVPMKWKQLRF